MNSNEQYGTTRRALQRLARLSVAAVTRRPVIWFEYGRIVRAWPSAHRTKFGVLYNRLSRLHRRPRWAGPVVIVNAPSLE